MLVEKEKKVCIKLGANSVMILLFAIISSIYSVYLTTYLLKLLTNTYEYEMRYHPEDMPVLAQLVRFSNNMVSAILTKLGGQDYQQNKGIVLGAILHWLLFWLLVSIIRCIFTDPGTVPKEWNDQTEQEINKCFEIEQQIFQKMRNEYGARKVGKDGERLSLKDNLSVPDESRREYQTVGGPGRQNDEENRIDHARSEYSAPLLEDHNRDDAQHDTGRFETMALLQIIKKKNKRFCSHCLKFKPERCHHCRQCNRCVLKMDHHCPWVINCIGFRNYKYFMMMLFYGSLSLLFVTLTYVECLYDVLFNPALSIFVVYLVAMAYTVNLTLTVIVTGFCGFHFWLVLRNKSTIEYCEKKDARYHVGKFRNFLMVFGENPLLWFFPFNPNLKGNGTEFQTRNS
eukprot:TRINITY_DN924_c0_g1_i1.p1 TRINITY_DN924_c0_g1~~TRINITY_DN924_c0_g1_i1.p1  ORF type:complete len:399 (-),score=48.06 TRINITY_DN924_c0_g1_i1:77-1273(-)